MVDWNNPQTVLAESLVLVKLLHLVDGIYIWEYFTTLWFEWEVFTERRPWRWTMIIYFATRLAALGGVCAELVGFNLTTRFDCQAWLLSVLITCYLAFALNSLLILLRTISIWERRPIISIALTAVWLTNVAFLIYGVQLSLLTCYNALTPTRLLGIAISKSVWLPLQNTCFIVDSQKAKLNVLVSAVTDLILLFAMIIGVIRLESDSSIWRHALSTCVLSGMVWIALATVGQVPPTTFLFLNLNEPMNLMFQTPALVIMTICATRLYRSLAIFGHRPAVFAPLASIQPSPLGVRFPRSISGGTPSLSIGSRSTGTNASLEVEFPTSYGRYRAEDLELVNDRLKAINEEGEECENDKVNGAC
ncbi:hypothetical protein BJY52DRAFT_1189075 [Lactarius psammicola]|nr:hypothetical protein BJY52DRAFT_1189075 [Lactarius psammicola]